MTPPTPATDRATAAGSHFETPARRGSGVDSSRRRSEVASPGQHTRLNATAEVLQPILDEALGVSPDRIYADQGLTGTNRDRPGLREALAACRDGDTLVVAKLDRLARSLPDARDIVDELTSRGVRLNIGGQVHDPNDPIGRLLFNVLAMVAEFESDLIRMRTREGMQVAKAKGRLRGKQPKLKPAHEQHLVELWRAGTHTSAELAELFGVARSTVYRAIQRAGSGDAAVPSD